MERRTFLKLAATTAVAAATRVAFPWAATAANRYVSYAGLLWRPGGAGRIEKSADNGRTWTLHSDLGDSVSITSIAVDRQKRLDLTVGFSGHTFPLVLAQDQRSWLTA